MLRYFSTRSSVIPRIRFKHKSLVQTQVDRQNNCERSNEKISNINEDQIQRTKSKKSSYISNVPISSGPVIEQEKYDNIFGIHPVLLALQSKRRSFNKLYYKENVLQKNERIRKIYEICKQCRIPTYNADNVKLQHLTGKDSVHQGVCLQASPLPFINVEGLTSTDYSLTKESLNGKYKLWVYLDQINDPMNLGAILRTAYYLGVDKLFCSKGNRCPISNIVSKASAGAAEVFPVYSLKEPKTFIESLKEYDWEIVAASTSKQNITLDQFQTQKSIFLIVGNEGRGISRDLEDVSDVHITVPSKRHRNDIPSLNVSVATSVLLYTLLNQFKME